MADDRDSGPKPDKLMKQARQLGGVPSPSRNQPDQGPPIIMPSDVLQGEEVPPVRVREADAAPQPRPRTPGHPIEPPNLPDEVSDPDLTEVGRPPPNPVTGRPASESLDVVPIGSPPRPAVHDETTQIRIDPEPAESEATIPASPHSSEDKPGSRPPKVDTISGKPKLATPEDLGMDGADLDKEPLLKWIAIGVGMMLFVAAAFAVVAVLVIAMAN